MDRFESFLVSRHSFKSMVIDDFHPLSIAIAPNETDSPLVINADTVLPGTFPGQSLQAIAGRHLQITQHPGAVQILELAPRGVLN